MLTTHSTLGEGGLIEKVKPLPSVFAFALSILRIRSHRFRHGNIARPICQTRSLCISAEAGVEEPMWVYLGFMRRFDREKRVCGASDRHS